MFGRVPPHNVIRLGVIMQKINGDKVAVWQAIQELELKLPKYTENLLKTLLENHDKLEKLYQGLLKAIGTSDWERFDTLWEDHLYLVRPNGDDYIGKDIDASRCRCNEHDALVSGGKVKAPTKYRNPLDKGCKFPKAS